MKITGLVDYFNSINEKDFQDYAKFIETTKSQLFVSSYSEEIEIDDVEVPSSSQPAIGSSPGLSPGSSQPAIGSSSGSLVVIDSSLVSKSDAITTANNAETNSGAITSANSASANSGAIIPASTAPKPKKKSVVLRTQLLEESSSDKYDLKPVLEKFSKYLSTSLPKNNFSSKLKSTTFGQVHLNKFSHDRTLIIQLLSDNEQYGYIVVGVEELVSKLKRIGDYVAFNLSNRKYNSSWKDITGYFPHNSSGQIKCFFPINGNGIIQLISETDILKPDVSDVYMNEVKILSNFIPSKTINS